MPFKPGQSGNPGGRPTLPEEIREFKKLNKVEVERILNKYLWLEPDQVMAEVNRPGCPMIEKIAAKIVSKAALDGDTVRSRFLFEWLVGKLPDRIDMGVTHAFDLRGLSKDQLKEKIEVYRAKYRIITNGDGGEAGAGESEETLREQSLGVHNDDVRGLPDQLAPQTSLSETE